MSVDWFTVGAQALNFLILVWLLKRFLYGPVLHAIDARDKQIATALANADAATVHAQQEHDTFQHRSEEFDQQSATRTRVARVEATAERQRLIDEAHQAADALTATRRNALRSDSQSLNQAIARRTQEEVFAIARKALTDLATSSLEERLSEVFTRRLREMNGPAKVRLGAALETASTPALIRSAFELPADQRAVLQNALNETFSADIHVQFETSPDVVCGIELSANGQKVGWSIAEYLVSLETAVDALLTESDTDRAQPEAARPNAAAGLP
jgi:F-type H+-transporting ATPase subunit b